MSEGFNLRQMFKGPDVQWGDIHGLSGDYRNAFKKGEEVMLQAQLSVEPKIGDQRQVWDDQKKYLGVGEILEVGEKYENKSGLSPTAYDIKVRKVK